MADEPPGKIPAQVLHRYDVIIDEDGRASEDFHLLQEDIAIGVNRVFAESFGVAALLPGSVTDDAFPANAGNPGVMVFVPDETGGATMAFSDGTNWLRFRDSVIVS